MREVERAAGDVEMARLRASEAAKAQLSPEQRVRFAAAISGDDPPDPPDAPARAGGVGAPGHPGGAPPAGSRPPGHTPPGQGGPPGHPPGGYRAPPPPHGHVFHPRVYGGVWPWYWWGYSVPVYPAPPPPAYWYYCPTYGAYYPDVSSCPEPWVAVPAG